MLITRELLDELTARAKASDRLRMHYDLRDSAEDGSMRMLNAIEPGTVIPVHRHRETSEDVIVLRGQVMALISGNVEPKFVYANSVENRASFFYEVTESKSNQVIRLGNGTFIDALKREDMQVSKTDVLGDYIL